MTVHRHHLAHSAAHATNEGAAPRCVPRPPRRDGDDPVSQWADAQAALLLRAQRRRVPAVLLTSRHHDLTLHDAYRVQAAGITRRIVAGAVPVGHKVGLTSAAMQQQMGVDEPDSGVLLDDMLVPAGGELLAGDFLAPRVEAEIAFRIGCDLAGPDVDRRTAQAAVSQVLLALEVIDTRFGDWRIGLVDSVADNASSARVVAGTQVAFDPVVDLAALRVVLSIDGVPVARGLGGAVLGDPLRALSWLTGRLHELGGGLRAGDLVLAGAVHASVALRAGTVVRAHCPELPPVHLRVR